MFFKLRNERKLEKALMSVCIVLKRQIDFAVTSVEWAKNDKDDDECTERMQDHFTWGYINGFIWSFLDTLNFSLAQKEKYEHKALKILLQDSGVSIMTEMKERQDETIRFGLGEEYAEEDFINWANKNSQPKKLLEFLVRGDKAIGLDFPDGI